MTFISLHNIAEIRSVTVTQWGSYLLRLCILCGITNNLKTRGKVRFIYMQACNALFRQHFYEVQTLFRITFYHFTKDLDNLSLECTIKDIY